MTDHSATLRAVAAEHNIDVTVGEVRMGPQVTAYGLIPEGGTKPRRLEGLVDSWSLAVGMPVRYRGVSGPYVIVEVPNALRLPVELTGLMPPSDELMIPFGLGTEPESCFARLAALPHLLVAGASGQGKSVFLNALIVSLLRQAGPDRLHLALVDPKRVELAAYAGLPHLIAPIARSVSEATDVLREVAKTMDERYQQMEAAGVKSGAELGLPSLVVVVDELADLMMSGGKQIETLLVRIAQVGRAAGVHLVLATQYPKREVITPLIKQNIPSQIAFTTSDSQASRLIVGVSGAEQLTGKGDALVSLAGRTGVTRVQAPMVDDDDIRGIVERWIDVAGSAAAQWEQEILARADEPTVLEAMAEAEDVVAQYIHEAAPQFVDYPTRTDTIETMRLTPVEPSCACDPDLPVKYARLERRVRELERLGHKIDTFMRAMDTMTDVRLSTGGE